MTWWQSLDAEQCSARLGAIGLRIITPPSGPDRVICLRCRIALLYRSRATVCRSTSVRSTALRVPRGLILTVIYDHWVWLIRKTSRTCQTTALFNWTYDNIRTAAPVSTATSAPSMAIPSFATFASDIRLPRSTWDWHESTYITVGCKTCFRYRETERV
jgi:hypothetical protein